MSINAITKLSPDGTDDIKLETYDVSSNDDIFDGSPVQKGAVFLVSEDGKTTMGVWESTPYAEYVNGGSHDEFAKFYLAR